MEVQHVITMLVETGYFDDVRWAQATLTSVLHLGYYLNDRRILWSVPAGLNRLKKRIPLRNWYQQGAWTWVKSITLRVPLRKRTSSENTSWLMQPRDGRTPFTELLDLSAENIGSSGDGADVADESCRDGNLQPTHWVV